MRVLKFNSFRSNCALCMKNGLGEGAGVSGAFFITTNCFYV